MPANPSRAHPCSPVAHLICPVFKSRRNRCREIVRCGLSFAVGVDVSGKPPHLRRSGEFCCPPPPPPPPPPRTQNRLSVPARRVKSHGGCPIFAPDRRLYPPGRPQIVRHVRRFSPSTPTEIPVSSQALTYTAFETATLNSGSSARSLFARRSQPNNNLGKQPVIR